MDKMEKEAVSKILAGDLNIQPGTGRAGEGRADNQAELKAGTGGLTPSLLRSR